MSGGCQQGRFSPVLLLLLLLPTFVSVCSVLFFVLSFVLSLFNCLNVWGVSINKILKRCLKVRHSRGGVGWTLKGEWNFLPGKVGVHEVKDSHTRFQ